jgi:integrase
MASSHRRRAGGEGAIYTTSDGRVRGSVWLDDPQTGKQIRRYVTGRSRTAVVAKLEELKRQSAAGALPVRGTVGEFLAGWLEASRQRIRPATWRQYESIVRVYLRPAVGGVQLSKLTPSHVERMTAALIAAGKSPRTAALARVVLRRALGDAQRDGLVPRNVAALARAPHVPIRALTAGRDYLAAEDLRRLVSGARLHPQGALFILAATSGLRLGELLGLSWSDVDLDGGTLTVRRSWARAWNGWALAEPKTARSRRTIHLAATAVDALRRHADLAGKPEPAAPVFSDERGNRLRPEDVNHAFHRLLEASGLPSVPFHALRHSAATAMLAGGVPLKVVSEALGHSTITITADRYSGVVPAQRRDAAAAIDRALGVS